MTVYKVRGGWRAEVFFAGRRVAGKSGFERRKDAEDWHDDTRRGLRAAPEGANEERRTITFDEILTDFETRHLPTVRHGTRDRYRVDITYRIRPFFGGMQVAAISPGLVEQFKAKCMADLAPKSVNNCLHLLRLIFNRSVRWGTLEKSPYAAETLAIPDHPYQWWSEESDIRKFLAAARESRYYAVYLTALETGMRYGEVVGLSKADIDFERGTIHVHRQWLERESRFGPVKHSKPRHIPFDPHGELAQALRRAILSSGHPEAVFTTATGARPTRGGLAHKFFRGIQKRAKVPQICFHALRHTFASWYMIRVGSVWDLMAILGHRNIQTTMRYAHHAQNARRQPLNLAGVTHISRTREGDIALTVQHR
jgi:integrase